MTDQYFTVYAPETAAALVEDLMSGETDGWHYQPEPFGAMGCVVVVAYDEDGVRMGPL